MEKTTRSRRRTTTTTVFRRLLTAFVAACLPGVTALSPGARGGDISDLSNTLVYAGENVDVINPVIDNHTELTSIVFSGLMKYDARGRPVPDLAESHAFDPATQTHTFKLKRGVKWHDGKELTADDVVFTYEALAGDETLTSAVTSNYEDIAAIASPAPDTVAIRLSRRNAAMLNNFTIGIVPRHLLDGRDMATAPFNQNPVGTGRYKLVEWDIAGGMLVLERNADYYGKVPGIERLVYRTVADESAKALMLQAGEADLAWLNAKYAELFRGRDGFRNIDFATADCRSVAFDFRTGFWRENGDSIGVLNHAVDKRAIVKSVLNGRGAAAYSPIQRNPLGTNAAADIYAHDPAAFAEKMGALGWAKGADGVYARNGQRFSFTVQVRDYEEERVDMANIVSGQLKEAGVDMKIAMVTRFDWQSGYDGFLAGFAAEFDPDQIYGSLVTGASGNNMRYSDPDVDALLKKGRDAARREERKRVYGEFEKAYARRPGHLLLAYLDGNYVGVAGLTGLDTARVLGHHAVGVMWNIEEWAIAGRTPHGTGVAD